LIIDTTDLAKIDYDRIYDFIRGNLDVK